MASTLGEVVELVEQRRVDARLIVGIAGEPGAGKSTIAALLVAALGPTAALLPMDGYHLPQARLRELGRRERMGAPDTFDVPGFAEVVRAVRDSGSTHYAADFDRTIEEPVPDALTFLPELRTIVVEATTSCTGPRRETRSTSPSSSMSSRASGSSASSSVTCASARNRLMPAPGPSAPTSRTPESSAPPPRAPTT